MNLTTPVAIPPSPLRLAHNRPVLLLGSCFSDEVGAKLIAAGFDVLCNPFGTLYNPESIAACLSRAVANQPITDQYLVCHEGLWHSWLHHGRFSHGQKVEALAMANQAIGNTHLSLQRHPVVIITFGTAWTFTLTQHGVGEAMVGQVVANCHKLPAAYFHRSRLSVGDIVSRWQPLLRQLGTDVLFTVSPIRHMADGAHGSQLSKATLLLAVDELMSPQCEYFPSYEIVMDELRDYRFYARDLCHVSDVAVDIVWERFQQTYMDAATLELCKKNEKSWRQSQHRPLH